MAEDYEQQLEEMEVKNQKLEADLRSQK